MNQNIIDRFWSKVDKTNKCWNWTAQLNGGGYGRLRVRNKLVAAHRLSWEIHNGEIPPGEHHGTTCVLHKCDNPVCVNPDHLFLGTQADNMRDMVKKNRSLNLKGSENGNSRLTESKVIEIKIWRECGYTFDSIGKAYGVSLQQIFSIVNGKSWSHVNADLKS